MKATAMNQTKQGRHGIRLKKILEVSFWGTFVWGVIRELAKWFHLTPYGLAVFVRPFNPAMKESLPAILTGFLILLLLTFLVSLLYIYVVAKVKVDWIGIIYGGVLLLLFGSFLGMKNWKVDTLSTELAWFITYGLFIGLTFSDELRDEE